MKILIQSEKYVLNNYYAKLRLDTIFSRAIFIGSKVFMAFIGERTKTENKTNSTVKEILLKIA